MGLDMTGSRPPAGHPMVPVESIGHCTPTDPHGLHAWEAVKFLAYERLDVQPLVVACLRCRTYTELPLRRHPDLIPEGN